MKLHIRQPHPHRWFLWAKREAKDYRTGETYWYRVLMIRLPGRVWGYRTNTDDMGWRQRALVWFHGRREQEFVHDGWNLIQIDPRTS